MNQFINEKNQSVLWKVVNSVSQVQHYFANAPPGAKEKWFQTHIGQIYQMYYGKSEPLQNLNKRAIDIMLNSLSASMQPSLSAPIQPSLSVPMQPSLSAPMQPSLSVPMQPSLSAPIQMQLPGQSIKSATMDEFSRRQAEYDMMINKQTPIANFSEIIKDEAIVDLNSAVEQYKKMRDPDPVIELQVEEIPSKKQVQWGTNQEHDHFETRILNAIANIEKDIAEIKSFIRESKDKPI